MTLASRPTRTVEARATEKIFSLILPRLGLDDLFPAEPGGITGQHAGADLDQRRCLRVDLADAPVIDQRRRAGPMPEALKAGERIDTWEYVSAQPGAGP